MVAALLALGGTQGVAWAAEPKPNLRLGLWRIDVEMTLPGKGPQANGPISQEVCITPFNLTQIVMPKTPGCTGRVTKQTAREMDWRMQCTQAGTETFSRSHVEFGGEEFAAAILTTAKQFNMEFRTVVRGKYLRACSAEQTRQAAQTAPLQNTPNPKAKPAPAPAPEKSAAPLSPYKD